MLGIGQGFFTPPNTSAIMGRAPQESLGVAGGMLNMTRGLGTSLGVAGAGAVLALGIAAYSGERVERTLAATPVALRGGLEDTLFFLAGLALLAAIVSASRAPVETQEPSEQRTTAVA